MRAEKRKKNAPKELERLKKILGTKADVIMEEVKEVATVLPPEKVLEQKGESGWCFLVFPAAVAQVPEVLQCCYCSCGFHRRDQAYGCYRRQQRLGKVVF